MVQGPERTAIIEQMKVLHDKLQKLDNLQTQITPESSAPKKKLPVMLTPKECAEQFEGIGEYTVRRLIAQKKIKYVRVGDARGRYLVNRDSLIEYLESLNDYIEE